ncbi:hypothetical protein [Phaeocystidibacter luteus]|uniref:Type II secretion system protein GspG C-terminal domain-containing protein n=1 Tax=Phaeocystidibacter luteus TaxID=911197 RepID=A0A6N6REL7_9FLAO|nr:hypothetical protein [Phaeocystidibacter luteus]KAB2807052.1 hypothetical protein F8C67_12725 [Phaeocystidibacter luteus]
MVTRKEVLLALMGLLPSIGLITGGVLLPRGVKRKSILLILLAILNLFLGAISLFGLVNTFQNSDEVEKRSFQMFSQQRMDGLVQNIEYYKLINDHYPDSLSQLYFSEPRVNEIDPIMVNIGVEPPEYNYILNDDNTYYLFSSGYDGVPFTSDDVLPSIEVTTKIGYRKSEVHQDTLN